MQAPRAYKLLLLQPSLLEHDIIKCDHINQKPDLNIISKYIMGAIFSGKPNSQCLLQDIRAYQQESCTFLSQSLS